MTEEQIEFLISLIKLTSLRIYLKEDGNLIPIIGIEKDFWDRDAEIGEPVAWLGGLNKCVSLWCVGADDFVIMNTNNTFFK